MERKGNVHGVDGNYQSLPQHEQGWFLTHQCEDGRRLYLRLHFLNLLSLSSINIVLREQSSINKEIINDYRNHCSVYIGSALTLITNQVLLGVLDDYVATLDVAWRVMVGTKHPMYAMES